MRNVDSKIRASRFDCCIFLFYSFSAATFATKSATNGLMHCSKQYARVSLFNHVVGNGEQPWRKAQTECLGSVEVDHQLEFGRLHDRKVGGLLALENPAGVNAGQATRVRKTRTVAHQAASFGSLTPGIDR